MSPKTLIIAASALAATALTTLPAAAAQGDTQPKPLPMRALVLFNLVDVNGDGSIDQTEMAALQRAIFASIDANSDGSLTQEEFGKMSIGPRGNRHGQMMGRGQGGEQGPGDHRGPRAGRQGQMGPRDGQGWGHHGPRGDRQGQAGPEDFGPGQGRGQGHGPGGMTAPQLGDNDGPDGFPGGQPRDFASLDTNGDGVISLDEFAAGAPAPQGPPQ